MARAKKALLSILLGFAFVLSLCFGIVFAMPMQTAKAATIMSTEGWSYVCEGETQFRVQNGTVYWTTGEGTHVTPKLIMDFSEINGKTLTEINEETPGAINVTLQAPGGSIGSFFRVNINTGVAGFSTDDIAIFVVKSGWTHTDSSGTYSLNTNLYFTHAQNKEPRDNANWKYIPASNVVDISDDITFRLQNSTSETTIASRALLFGMSDKTYWTSGSVQPNEAKGTFLNLIEINGKSIKQWNKEAVKLAESGEIADITFGSTLDPQKRGGVYAPIYMHNSGYVSGIGSFFRAYVPSEFIDSFASVKVNEGYAYLMDNGTLYYVGKDVEFVNAGGNSYVKVASTVDISDSLTFYNGGENKKTYTYYVYTKGKQTWTQNYGATGNFPINENEWKGVSDSSKQGGTVQMSYIYVNGTSVYDINANDNNTYNSENGSIVNGGKYAPIMGWLTPYETNLQGSAVFIQIPTNYPGNRTTIKLAKGFYVVDTATNIKYEVTRDIQWDFENGTWVEHTNKIETTVTDARLFGSASDAFAGIKLEGSDYNVAPGTYAGDVKTAKVFAQSANFRSYILVDDKPLATPSEAFLNVWGNYGYFTFRPGNNTATKLTILAGCQFPTYNALRTGAKEVYVTTEDITFVKDGSSNWVKDEGTKTVTFMVDSATYDTQKVPKNECVSEPAVPTKTESDKYTYKFKGWYLNDVAYDFSTPVTENITLKAVFTEILKAGEYNTSIANVTYARDKANNWMMFMLTEKDYPKASEVYNFATKEDQMSALNLYDKIVVDGYTLRSRIEKHGAIEAPKVNLWQSNCLGIRIAGAAGALDGAKKVTIRAGAQFPSYAYITEGVEAYYVTTEEITFMNVGNENGDWERQYRATFVVDGVVVETIPYLASKGFTAPEVPEKEGYRGEWEKYTANGNITVNAVYTKKPIVLGTTGIKELRNIDKNNAVFVILPTNSDYPDAPNLGLGVSHLQKFNLLDYITINGKTLREIGVTEMAINKWTRPGLGLTTTLSSSMTIEIKKGCEIPSYAFWQNPNGEASCYTVDTNYTAVYSAAGENAFVITSEAVTPNDFEDHYILSDLYKAGYGKTSVLQDGIETLVRTDGSETDYRYGHIDSKSFTLSFDFKYDNANWYETFAVMFGTDGYNSVKACFGWRFFLLRGSDKDGISNSQCVQFFSGCDKGADGYGNLAAPAINGMYFVAGQTYHVTIGYKLIDADTVLTYVSIDGNELAKAQYDLVNTHDTYGKFSSYSSYMDTISFYKENNGGAVTISNPDMDMTVTPHKLVLKDGADINHEILTDSYVLPALNPAEYDMAGNVFVGWTTNANTFPDLYPAGYEFELTKDVTLYPVWINFTTQNGAAVRKAAPSGIRFSVDIDKPYYEAGVQLGYFIELGTILAPTSYLTNRELTHELGEDYYVAVKTTEWNDGNTYSAAFTHLSADQFTRSFSARGYIKVQYTTGKGYIYAAYDANEHARSMYEVANAAKKAGEQIATDVDYINSVADIIVNANLSVSKNTETLGNYTINANKNGNQITVTVGNAVKSVMVNGVRLVMGYDAQIIIDGAYYTLNGYSLSSNGLIFKFALEKDANSEYAMKKYHTSVIQSYLDSDAYTVEHKAYIVDYITEEGIIAKINDSETVSDYIDAYNDALEELNSIKTAAELKANNTSKNALIAPVLSKGLGYTVTWTAVADADYYTISDDNDYRAYTVVMADETLSYKPEVVGNHNITVTAHSYYEKFNSATSNVVTTPEVKPVFSYKSMQDGLYKFSSSQMSTMGISTTGCYYDSSDKKYFVYYNKDTGWSPNGALATDWTSPAEFPAHAQRLKDMGNNIILVARDTKAEFKADDTWEASRLRYVMDTAWSMGMKVLVCDEVFYKLSMSDNSSGHATSKAQVTTAINNRIGFADYVTHPAFYGFSLDDEPYAEYLDAMEYTISALDEACEALGVSDPFYLACLFQSYGSDKVYTGNTLINYYKDWLNISGVDNKYLYVDIYTQHAMDYPFYSVTNRYENSFDAVYGDLGGKYNFYQAITSHTQNDGTLSEQDLYMSLLYAAAHDVAGYSWFCYFPIAGELAGCMVGYDGNGYGNGIGNKASGSYYNAAKTAGAQYELIQGWLDGYDWKTRKVSGDLLTTTLSNGTNTATMYVNADEDKMKTSVTVTASGSTCYLIGYGVGTAEMPYRVVSGSVTLAPGQAVLCME